MIRAAGYEVFTTEIDIPENGTSDVHRYVLKPIADNVQLRIMRAQSNELMQNTAFQMPALIVGLFFTIFLVLGVQRVRRVSRTPIRSR